MLDTINGLSYSETNYWRQLLEHRLFWNTASRTIPLMRIKILNDAHGCIMNKKKHFFSTLKKWQHHTWCPDSWQGSPLITWLVLEKSPWSHIILELLFCPLLYSATGVLYLARTPFENAQTYFSGVERCLIRCGGTGGGTWGGKGDETLKASELLSEALLDSGLYVCVFAAGCAWAEKDGL